VRGSCQRLIASVLGGVLLLSPAAARGGEPAVLAASAGAFDALQQDDPATEFGLQWRGGGRLWKLAPMLGAMATTEGGLLGYLGFSLDLPLGRHFAIRGSFAPAAYEKGNGKELYSVLQFRSGIEAFVRFGRHLRVGVELYHVSNGGITDLNPGESSVVLTLAVPLSGSSSTSRPSPSREP
jgi:lipid A 3-O-deacylase